MSGSRFVKRYLLLIVILIGAFGLRVKNLEERNIWWDEGYSNWLIRHPFLELLDITAHDVHPPLYYLVLRIEWLITGDGEFVLRYPSVLLGLLTVACIYGVGKALGGERVGVLGMALLSLSRLGIRMSQEIRMHMLAALLVTVGLWAVILIWRNLFRQQKLPTRPTIIYAGCAIGALYTFYPTIALPLAVNLAFIVSWWYSGRRWRLLGYWMGLHLIMVGLFLPWYI